MSYDLTGKIAAIFPVVQATETFRKREFVVEKTEEIGSRIINNYIKFQVLQDKVTLLDKLSVGDSVKVHFNIKGSKWAKDGREGYITNLDAWRIENFVGSTTETAPTDTDAFTSADPSTAPVDDLPF
jgi:predicted nuclease with TOPRIM domain